MGENKSSWRLKAMADSQDQLRGDGGLPTADANQTPGDKSTG